MNSHPTSPDAVDPLVCGAADSRLESQSLVLRHLASLLSTHRYYGSVHATCKECLDLQKNELPKLFDRCSDGAACCQIPSLDLQQQPAVMTAEEARQANSPLKSTKKPIEFAKDKLPSLPLSLLEECSNIFNTIWKGRLYLAKKTTKNSAFLEMLHKVPTSPATVATNVKSLSFAQRCPPDSSPLVNKIDKAVIPMIVSLVMDWKLPNDETISITAQIPGIIEGTFAPNASLQFASIDFDKATLTNVITSRVKSLLKDCLIGVHRMKISPDWKKIQPNVHVGVKEEEMSYVDDRGLTPLQQLFETASPPQDKNVNDEKRAKRSIDQISKSATRVMPQSGGKSRRFSFDRLSILSRAASQLQTPFLRSTRHKHDYGGNKNAEFDTPTWV